MKIKSLEQLEGIIEDLVQTRLCEKFNSGNGNYYYVTVQCSNIEETEKLLEKLKTQSNLETEYYYEKGLILKKTQRFALNIHLERI